MALDVTTPDGRSLEVLDAGPADGFPLLFHHGTPQGAVPWPMIESAAAERGLRTISYSRPGYGRSTPHPVAGSATVADDARDATVVLDHLGLGAFVTLGWSGGGPRALACAAVLTDRCRAAACCVGIAPAAEYDGDLRDGMGEDNVEEYTAAFAGTEALRAYLGPAAESLGAVTADGVVAAMESILPEVDRRALTGELAECLADSMRHAMRQGPAGWLNDDLTHVGPWGFDLSRIEVPVSVWQGTLDLMVPLAHARWLADHVAGAEAHLVEGEGHLSLLARVGDVLDDLVRLAAIG